MGTLIALLIYGPLAAIYIGIGYAVANMVNGGGWRWWLTLFLWPLAIFVIIYALIKWAASGSH